MVENACVLSSLIDPRWHNITCNAINLRKEYVGKELSQFKLKCHNLSSVFMAFDVATTIALHLMELIIYIPKHVPTDCCHYLVRGLPRESSHNFTSFSFKLCTDVSNIFR